MSLPSNRARSGPVLRSKADLWTENKTLRSQISELEARLSTGPPDGLAPNVPLAPLPGMPGAASHPAPEGFTSAALTHLLQIFPPPADALDISPPSAGETGRLLARVDSLIRSVISNTSDAFFVKNLDGQYVLANHVLCEMLGRPLPQILGKTDFDLQPLDSAETVLSQDYQVLEARRTFTYEYDFRMFDGSIHTFSATKYLWIDENGQPQGVIGVARDITGHKELEQEQRYQVQSANAVVDRLQRLTEITRLLSSTLDLPTLLSQVVRLAADLVGAEAGMVALVEPDEKTMVYPYLYNLPDRLVKIQARRGEGLSWEVVEKRIGLLFTQYHQYQHALPELLEAGVREILAVPLLAGNERIGALSLVQVSPALHFKPDDLQITEVVARQAAVAIQNARLFKSTQRQLNRLDSLHAIDLSIAANPNLDVTIAIVLSQTCRQLGVDAAAILLLEEPDGPLAWRGGFGFRDPALAQVSCQPVDTHGADLMRFFQFDPSGPVDPDLVLVDPGFLTCPLLEGEGFCEQFAYPLITHGVVKGFLVALQRSPFQPDQEWLDFLRTLAGQTAIALDNATLFEDLEAANQDLIQAYDTTLAGWARALELRDQETEGHSERVTLMTLELARAIGIPEEEIAHIRRGARLHDIGKMGVPDSILHKPGPLTSLEWEIMRKHPVYAYEMLRHIPFLKQAIKIPYCHHEKWDGTGYPRGLKGEEISLAARIFAIVDVYDALRSRRPYRPALPEEEVISYIQAQSGSHFDPRVVEVFLQQREKWRNIIPS